MLEKERRVALIGVELRAEGEARSIVGYAAKFNARTEIFDFYEEIASGAFDRALSEGHDVRALVDHDPSKILGRTKAGTLALEVDQTGLLSRITPPETQTARDIQESIGRGDVTGMSFAFRVLKDEWRTENGKPLRVIRDLELYDVSVVTYPAYEQTEVSLRAKEQAAATVAVVAPPPAPEPPLARLEREIGLIEREG